MQSTTEAITLIDQIKNQINSGMPTPNEREEAELLLDNLAVYAKRVTGQELNERDLRIRAHDNFSGLVAVPQRQVYDSLLRRLRIVQRFRIVSYEKVTRDLLHGLMPKKVDSLNGRDVRLLTLLYNKPEESPVKIAQELGVSVPTIRKQITNLQEKASLRFANLVNWSRFKLRHIGLFFITPDVETSRRLESVFRKEMKPYLTSAVFDTTYRRGFAGFLIPDQTKPLHLFKRQIQVLQDVYLETVQVHETMERYVSICFDHFDYESGDWLIEGDVTTLGLLNFVRQNWEVLPKPRGIKFTPHNEFDQLDYYLAVTLGADGRARMKKVMMRLKSFDIEAPRTTISTRKNNLNRNKSIVPYVLFNSPLLPFFITFAIKCDNSVSKEIATAVAQMPHGWTAISNIGCVINVKVPMRSLGSILHLLSMLREEEGVEEVWQMQQYSNMGSSDPATLGHKWNGKFWSWDEQEFSLPPVPRRYV